MGFTLMNAYPFRQEIVSGYIRIESIVNLSSISLEA